MRAFLDANKDREQHMGVRVKEEMVTQGVKVKHEPGVKEDRVDNGKPVPTVIDLCDSDEDEEGGDTDDGGEGGDDKGGEEVEGCSKGGEN